MLKQVIVVRADLDLPSGKLASQVAHASLEAGLQAKEDIRDEWRGGGAKKAVVTCSDEQQLQELARECDADQLPYHVVRDAGETVVRPGTVTALGVGPGDENAVDSVTGSLSLL